MVQRLTSPDTCMQFIDGIRNDPSYSDPMFSTPVNMAANLFDVMSHPDYAVLGAYRGEEQIGLFSFLILREERYAEMLVGLSRDAQAYEEIADYLRQNCAGFQVDFVFNPQNRLITAMLEKRGASFLEEQQKMVLTEDTADAETDGVVPLSDAYLQQYCAIHEKDCYWTAEKVAEAKDVFKVFLAVDRGEVVGYLDITADSDENEPFDLFVKESYRRRGWGRKLLKRAIIENRPNRMILFVDVDNKPAIALYSSMGFTKAEGQNSLTATWNIAENVE